MTLYRIDSDKWAEHFEQDLDDLAWYVKHGVLVPVEIDRGSPPKAWTDWAEQGPLEWAMFVDAWIGGDDEAV